jgi:hypothetical protein
MVLSPVILPILLGATAIGTLAGGAAAEKVIKNHCNNCGNEW